MSAVNNVIKKEEASPSLVPLSVGPPVSSQESYESYPLKACTQEEIEDTRFHILKFHSVKKINPASDFQEPAKLHRKDPKNLQFQLSLKELEEKKIQDKQRLIEKAEKRREYLQKKGLLPAALTDEQIDESIELEGMTPEERTRWEDQKRREAEEAKKQAKKEADLLIVAPDGGARKSKKQIFKKKTRQIRDYDEEKKKLRYEEFYPWVMEDYDAKQAWVGNYEAGNTDNYCLLVLDNENKCFKLMPVEKFYKFTSRNKYATLTLEEAEAKMKEGSSSSRWLMKRMAEEAGRGERVDLRYRKMKTTSRLNEDETKRSDDEALDYDEEFQDDEEAPILEGNDEESKLVENKMKKEMLRASNLIETDPQDDDLDDLFDARKIDKEGKKLRNALAKNAMNEVYDTDDEEDENPYLSESETEDPESKNNDNEIKVKKEDSDSEKLQNAEEADGSTSTEPTKKRKIYVESYSGTIVTLKVPSQVLTEFPPGDWNPRLSIKRSTSPEHVLENGQPLKKIKIKMESREESPVLSDASGSAASNANQITKEDIDVLLNDGPLELPLLIKALKAKVSANPNVKSNLKAIMKDHFSLKNGKVYRKNK
ncbi:hypothetical protein CANARDRAFT_28608 [[Candida] arabinofermentans NRRL YB-2248]|uniref:Uncharacterized protein n=1 Tax=[Candida] arabinofermentans NRRL YB-2248 TaxID=983967 RepID=A0A1E4SZF6_9ASCO|nr:hypothetical protein CANARDRAFT_28608 [[Candida] arabinofermentans NRRL YB-2248]